MQIYGRQLAAARVLLGISQSQLASATSLSVPTIRRMEASSAEVTGLPNNVKAIRSHLESQGIEFTFHDTLKIGVTLSLPRTES
jgi:transcriptional regulator with XRE-family HTH domain